MDYELKFWEALLTRNLSDPAIIAQLDDQLTAENQRVRLALLETACSNLPAGTIENQMRIHQDGLILLDERISRVADPRIKTWLEKAFIHLHDDLQAALTTYWPPAGRIPRLKLEPYRQYVRERMEPIRRGLREKHVSPELTELVLKLIGAFIEEDNRIYEVWYKVKGLTDALLRGDMDTEKVVGILLELDLDDYDLFQFLQTRVLKILTANVDLSTQLISLRGQLSYIRHHKEQGKLRSMFCEWLEALVQEKQRVAVEGPALPALPPMPAIAAGDMEKKMILTSLSSSELGCLLRLFIDTDVFANDNIKAVAQFMAHFVGTKKKGVKTTRSVNNLYANIYTIPESTSLSVDRILQTMMERNTELRLEAKEKDKKKRGGN